MQQQYQPAATTSRYSKWPIWIRCITYMLTLIIVFPFGIWVMIKDPEYRWKHFFLTIWWGYLCPCLIYGIVVTILRVFIK
jgi:hypothetical protein